MPRQHFLRSLALLVLAFLCAWPLLGQPRRIAYFPYDEAGRNLAALDPGSLLLERNVMLTNFHQLGNISLRLSFDRQNWADYSLGPYYSSLFNTEGQAGFYVGLVTDHGGGRRIRKEYYLTRGRCYSVYWNAANSCWDAQENRCQR
ncbi:MAG: hypothetical protein HC821_01080 [Lewinella sp.]|nr:hypothetical protein [Lewinella sp.]